MNTALATRESARPDAALANQYLPFVRRVAHRLARRLPSHVRLEDLVSAGIVGLLEAMDRFDPGRQNEFESYAEFRVKGAILDELRRRDLMARDARLASKEIESCARRLTQALGRPPEEEEMARELGLSVDELREKLEKLTPVRVVSFEDLESDRPNTAGRSPLDEAMREELLQNLAGAVGRLSERHQQVLALYYKEELTLREIGDVLDVSESRVCQILSEATLKLRAMLDIDAKSKRARSGARRGDHG
jgi:RNA polymerase sigma factor for flagellar operon FliA